MMSLCDIYRSSSEDKCRESPGLQLHTTKAFDMSNRCKTSRNLKLKFFVTNSKADDKTLLTLTC